MNTKSREKLTITIDKDVLNESKKASKNKGIPLSRAIENFLKFFSKPWVYCFNCSKKFNTSEGKLCAKCGWTICPKCNECRCSLDEKVAVPIFYMRKVYEELLGGRVE